MTLRLRIFLFNLVSVFLATFVVAIIGLKIVESTIIDSTFERLTQIRIAKTTAIENYFRDLHRALGLISSHERTGSFLKSNAINKDTDFRHTLDNYVLDFNIYDMGLIDKSGRILYTTRKDVPDGVTVYNGIPKGSRLKDLFQWATQASPGVSLFVDFIQDTINPNILTGFVAAPIHREGKFIGALVLKVSISEIDRITSDNFAWATHGMGQTGDTLLYGEDWTLRNTGRFPSTPHSSQASQNGSPNQGLNSKVQHGDENLKIIKSAGELRDIGYDYRGQKVIRSIGKIYLPNGELWYIQTKIDESEAFAVLDRIAIASGAAGVLIFILFFFATFAATGKVVEPIQLLTDRLETLGTKNLTQKINYQSRDEIGLLVTKYNQLADRLEATTVSKEFLNSVIQSIKTLLFIVKISPQKNEKSNAMTYQILNANEAAIKTLGISPDEISKVDLKQFIQAPSEFSDYTWLLQTRHSIQANLSIKDGQTIPILMNWGSLPSGASQDLTFVFVCTDISDRIEAENALIQAREQAVKASQAKSEFLARMSHEIRTPLNAIIGITDILADSNLDPEQDQLVKVCANASENLLALINDILDLSKIEAREVHLEKISYDLIATTKNSCDVLKPKALEKNLRFNLNISLNDSSEGGESHRVLGDPTRLRQILFNLIGNAIKFTSAGEISVSLEFADPDHKFLRFTIRDTGIGIPRSKQDVLFQSFVQADNSITRKFGGSGLGLTISKNLVELMGGKIGFTSEENKGSAFFFTIPNNPAENTTEISAPQEIRPLPTGIQLNRNARILVVDDTEDNRFLLLTYLKKLPFCIIQAENGQMAVELATKENFDLILMDIQMPIMDGYVATQKIREWEKQQNKKPVPIIAVSANAMVDDVKKSLTAGCSEHLNKPVKKTALLQIVERYLS